jgi:hypothetical protein
LQVSILTLLTTLVKCSVRPKNCRKAVPTIQPTATAFLQFFFPGEFFESSSIGGSDHLPVQSTYGETMLCHGCSYCFAGNFESVECILLLEIFQTRCECFFFFLFAICRCSWPFFLLFFFL